MAGPMKYLLQLKLNESGWLTLLEKEILLRVYATFTRLQLIIGKEQETTESSAWTVSFTNQRLLMTSQKLSASNKVEVVGWALDRCFIHEIQDCAGGLFKASKRIRLILKDPNVRSSEEVFFELRFPEDDSSELKKSFRNVQKIVDLCFACEKDSLEDFQKLFNSNQVLVNMPIDSTKNTLLIMACALNRSAVAMYLLRCGSIHIDTINKVTRTPVKKGGKMTEEVCGALYYACINGMEEVVEKLLSLPTTNVNILYSGQHTALEHAIIKDRESQSPSNTSSKKSYSKIICMLMSHPKTTWKIADNDDEFAIPPKWILETTYNTQKAILRCSRANELTADLRQELTIIQEKQRKTQSYKSLNGQVVRLDSSSTIATEEIESSSKIYRSDSFQSISSNAISLRSFDVGNVDPLAEEINRCKAFCESLGLTPTLQLSFASLKTLKLDDDVDKAILTKSFEEVERLAKQKKQWNNWKDQISEKQLPEPLKEEGFESIKKFLLAEIKKLVKYHVNHAANAKIFAALDKFQAEVECLTLYSKEETTTAISSTQICKSDSFQSNSSKINSVLTSSGVVSFDPVAEEISKCKAFCERLELSPTLQLAFVILRTLKIHYDIERALSTNSFKSTSERAKQKKQWDYWKDEISMKQLPEPLDEEDFESIKKFLLAEIKKLVRYHISKAADEIVFQELNKFKDEVEALTLSSKENPSDNPAQVSEGPTSSTVLFPSTPLPPNKTSHVFISHAWALDGEGRDNHQRVKRLNDILKKRGIVTWFDDDRIRQYTRSLRDILAKALDSACCVLICITKEYEEKVTKGDESDNCLYEFNAVAHCELASKRMTAVMERSMLDPAAWGVRLKAELRGKLYTDLSSDVKFEENCEVIVQNIINMLQLP